MSDEIPESVVAEAQAPDPERIPRYVDRVQDAITVIVCAACALICAAVTPLGETSSREWTAVPVLGAIMLVGALVGVAVVRWTRRGPR